MNRTKKLVISSAAGTAALLVPGYGSVALADTCTGKTGTEAVQCGADQANPNGSSTDLPAVFKNISNILLVIVGFVSVIMLIIGGLRYVLSAGNSSSVEGAKNTILFAIIGIIVALIAGSIINFVIGKF